MPDVVDPKAKITALIQRRDRLQANVQRVKGRLDSARSELAASEEDCRNRKVDPSNLDDIITKLEARLATETANFESKLTAAEAKVAPYLKED